MDITPIWQQLAVNLGTAESQIWRADDSATGETIYTGKAWKRPDADSIIIYPNDIAETLFASDIPDFSKVHALTDLSTPQFEILKQGATQYEWTSVEVAWFWRDWSYKSHSRSVLSDFPSSGAVLPWNCPLAVSFMSAGTSAVHIVVTTYANGTTNEETFTNPRPFTYSKRRQTTNVVAISVDGISFEVTSCGCEFALLYRNKWGGYDVLPMWGVRKQSDKVTRNAYDVPIMQTADTMSERASVQYLNEIVQSWTMCTGVVTDGVAEMVADLLTSPEVWLFDELPSEGTPIPVNVTDSTAEHSTYRNNGYQPLKFTITAELAQPRIRR